MHYKNYEKELGDYIRQERQNKGHSLKQLSQLANVAENTLLSLEKGRGGKQETVELTLTALGKSLTDFYEIVSREIYVRWNNATAHIGQLMHDRQYAQARVCYEKLKEETYYRNATLEFEQEFAYYEGVLLMRLDKQPEQALEVFIEALAKKRPKLFLERELHLPTHQVDAIWLKQTPLTRLDYRMLASVANIWSNMGENQQAADLEKAVLVSLSLGSVAVEARYSLLLGMYFNLSRNLLTIQAYEEAFAICDDGIELHKKIKSVKYLGELYDNKASGLASLGKIVEAKHFYRLACEQFFANAEQEKVEITRKYALDKYKIVVEIS